MSDQYKGPISVELDYRKNNCDELFVMLTHIFKNTSLKGKELQGAVDMAMRRLSNLEYSLFRATRLDCELMEDPTLGDKRMSVGFVENVAYVGVHYVLGTTIHNVIGVLGKNPMMSLEDCTGGLDKSSLDMTLLSGKSLQTGLALRLKGAHPKAVLDLLALYREQAIDVFYSDLPINDEDSDDSSPMNIIIPDGESYYAQESLGDSPIHLVKVYVPGSNNPRIVIKRDNDIFPYTFLKVSTMGKYDAKSTFYIGSIQDLGEGSIDVYGVELKQDNYSLVTETGKHLQITFDSNSKLKIGSDGYMDTSGAELVKITETKK